MDKEKFNNMQDYVTWKKKPIKSLDTKAKQYEKENPGAWRIGSSFATMETIKKRNISNIRFKWVTLSPQ